MPASTGHDFICPISAQINPHVEELQQRTIAWADRFQLLPDARAYQRFQAGKFWILVARCYPNAAIDDLAIVAYWDTWGFYLDDITDDGPMGRNPQQLAPIFADLLTILRGGSVQDRTPLFLSFGEVCDLIKAQTTPQWQAHFVETMTDCFSAYLWEATNRANGAIPTIQSFIPNRRLTSGLPSHLDLADITEHIVLEPSVLQHPQVLELTTLANDSICLANDVFSLAKEQDSQDFHNMVMLVAYYDHCSIQSATEQVVEMHNAKVRSYLALEEQLPDFGATVNGELKKYVGILRSWMRGNLDWSQDTGRYRPQLPQLEDQALSDFSDIA